MKLGLLKTINKVGQEGYPKKRFLNGIETVRPVHTNNSGKNCCTKFCGLRKM